MWSLIRLTSLNWCCIKTYTHTYTPAPPANPPRTTWASGVINVSVIQGCVRGARQGRWAAAARLRADISGRRVSDVSLLLPGGRERQGIWLGPKQWARRKVTAQPGVINKTRSWVSPTPLSISVATSHPNCICSGSHTHTQKEAEKKKTWMQWFGCTHKHSYVLMLCAGFGHICPLMWEVSYQLDHIYSQQQLWLNLILVMTHSEQLREVKVWD